MGGCDITSESAPPPTRVYFMSSKKTSANHPDLSGTGMIHLSDRIVCLYGYCAPASRQLHPPPPLRVSSRAPSCTPGLLVLPLDVLVVGIDLQGHLERIHRLVEPGGDRARRKKCLKGQKRHRVSVSGSGRPFKTFGGFKSWL